MDVMTWSHQKEKGPQRPSCVTPQARCLPLGSGCRGLRAQGLAVGQYVCPARRSQDPEKWHRLPPGFQRVARLSAPRPREAGPALWLAPPGEGRLSAQDVSFSFSCPLAVCAAQKWESFASV